MLKQCVLLEKAKLRFLEKSKIFMVIWSFVI